MKIGYSVEGSTDRALIVGLRRRWCPDAELIEGHFRGSTKMSLRREYRKICEELAIKGVTWMVFQTDANDRPWREVQRGEREKFPPGRLPQAIHGVADRNVECWICADPEWLGKELGWDPEPFRGEDPKRAFERAMGITRDEKREREIADLVARGPLRSWVVNRSFQDFCDQIWAATKHAGCSIENLRES